MTTAIILLGRNGLQILTSPAWCAVRQTEHVSPKGDQDLTPTIAMFFVNKLGPARALKCAKDLAEELDREAEEVRAALNHVERNT